MITDAILGVLLAGMRWLVELLPDGEPLGLAGATGLWVGYAQLNTFLPLTEILAAVAVVMTVHVGILLYWAAKEGRSWLPFV